MLKQVLASLALTVGLSHASIASEQKLSIEIPCADLAKISQVLEEFQEVPLFTSVGKRIVGDKSYDVPTVMFANPETRSWTLVEQVSETMYCVSAMGVELRPYIKGPTI